MILPGIINFFKIIGFLIFSWILIHFFAVFGPFVAVSYPIWWFFVPKKTFCLFCRIKKEGEICPFCHQVKKENEGNYPKNFRSIFLNSFLVLFFSIASFGLVFVEGRVLFKLGFPSTPKTVSFIIPSKGQFRLGENFPMKIDVAGIKTPINAIQADITFDPEQVEVIDINTADSFANIFIQKEINNEAGYARLSGGLPNPGFYGDHGIFGTVYFRGKVPGLTQVKFLPSSLVLANDGRGTNILKDLATASYLILPEKITEEEQEQQEVSLQTFLNEKTSQTQLRLYQEQRVLGSTMGLEFQKGKVTVIWQTLYNFFEKIDRFILSFWEKIFSR